MTATESDTLDLGRLATIAESGATEENQLTVTVVAAEEAPGPVGPAWTIAAVGQLVTICSVREDPGAAVDLVDHVAAALDKSADEGIIDAIDPAAPSAVVIADETGPALVAFLTPTPGFPDVERRSGHDPLDAADGLLSLGMLREVPLEVSAELGHTRLSVAEILQLNVGSVIELDRTAGAPVDVLVNGSLIAVGEVVVIDDEYGVRITEIVGRVSDSI